MMLGGILRRGPDPLITEAAGETLAPWRQYLSESNWGLATTVLRLRGDSESVERVPVAHFGPDENDSIL